MEKNKYEYLLVVFVYINTISPFRTAVPFWGQTTQILINLSPNRDCGPKRVNGSIIGDRGLNYFD